MREQRVAQRCRQPNAPLVNRRRLANEDVDHHLEPRRHICRPNPTHQLSLIWVLQRLLPSSVSAAQAAGDSSATTDVDDGPADVKVAREIAWLFGGELRGCRTKKLRKVVHVARARDAP